MLSKRLSGAAVVIGVGLSVLPAHAQYVVTLKQEGGDVVAAGSGSIDLAGLCCKSSGGGIAAIVPMAGLIETGPPSVEPVDFYETPNPEILTFGSGAPLTYASSGSGATVGTDGGGNFEVPEGYISGSALSDTSTYDGASFARLGLTPGVYKATWGSSGSFTIIVASPEPSTWILMLAGFAGLGFAAWRARDMSRALRPRHLASQ